MKESLEPIKKSLAHILSRYHVLIFTLTVLVGVAIAIIMLNSTLALSEPEDQSPQNSSAFDQQAIDAIDKLRSSDEDGPDPSPPAGRTNPFAE